MGKTINDDTIINFFHLIFDIEIIILNKYESYEATNVNIERTKTWLTLIK